jgi:SAM-dependent methyltransferase
LIRADDPEFVREQYATEEGLKARASLYLYGDSRLDARSLVVEELQRERPRRVVEVGCGFGELAEWIAHDVGCDVVATDQSERMVELSRERGLDARVADVQDLPFTDGEFDAAVAAWMLYHVPDLDRALAELRRVLRPGGTLVAVTNGASDFQELWDYVGRDVSDRTLTFRAENGEEHLLRYFASVARRDITAPIVFPDADAMRRYVGSSARGRSFVNNIPDTLEQPFVATKTVAVFVARKAA